MPLNDLPFPKPSAVARQALDAAKALAVAGDAARAREAALPLLGEPALHAEVLLLLFELSRRLEDRAGAVAYAARAARLAPNSARATSLHALARLEAGQFETALAQALAARDLDPAEARANATAVLAALRLGRPFAAVDAALALLRAEPCPAEAAALAASLLDACAPGAAWGLVFFRDGTVQGLIRRTGPELPVVALTADGLVLGRVTAGTPLFPQAGLYGFCFPLPKGLALDAAIEATVAPSGQPLYGSPLSSLGRKPDREGFRGEIRLAPDGRLAGHALDLAAPDKRLVVTLSDEAGEAGTQITVAAATFDAGLLPLGHGDGGHAFAVPWPHDPVRPCARVTAVEAATGTPLAGSPLLVPNPPVAAAALGSLCAWLRRTGLSPDAPPPLPEACQGIFLDFARQILACEAAALEARISEPQEDDDA